MKKNYVIAVIILCCLLSCRQKAPEEAAVKRTPVRVADVQREKLRLTVTAGGIVVPAQEIKLSFKTGGIIAGIYVSEGARVSKGEVLAVLNLSEVDAQVKQVLNAYEKAVRDYNRVKNLYTDSVATLEQLQNAETAVSVSKAALEAANFNLEYSRIVAPEQGTILKQLAETDEIIAPGFPVFLFGASGKGWKIRTGLADRDFVRINRGDTALVTMDAYPGETLKATISQVSEAANPQTGTYEIELDLQPTGHKLASGFVVNLEIFPGKADSCIYIPVQAMVEMDGNRGFVFTVDDSMRAKKVQVSIIRIFQSSLAVSGGPDLSGRIITEGAAYLSDGDPIVLAD